METETEIEKRTPGITHLRELIRQQAREGEIWQELDRQMGEVLDLSRLVSARQVELGEVDGKLTAANNALSKVSAERDGILTAAQSEAEQIVASASSTRESADDLRRQADEALKNSRSRAAAIVSDAEAKAAGIVDAAKAEAERINSAIAEIRRVA